MIATIVIGLIFAGVLGFAAKKSISDAKNNKCSGCGASCSSKSNCKIGTSR